MRIGMSLLVNVSPMCQIAVTIRIGMRILGNVFLILLVLPLLSGMPVVGNVFPDSLLVFPAHNGMNVVENAFPDSPLAFPVRNGMNVVENVFPDSPLVLPVRIGMKVVEYVFKLHLPIHSAINARIVAFPTIHEGIKVSNE